MTRLQIWASIISCALSVAACSGKNETSKAGTNSSGAEVAAALSKPIDMKGGMADGCSLLSPEEIATALGGTASKGVPEAPGNMCHFKLNGQTKYGPAKDIEVYVANGPWVMDRTNKMYEHIPMVDLPELGPDAFLVGTGGLHIKAANGSEIHIELDRNLFGGSSKRLLDAKADFVQLGKAAISHMPSK